MAYGGDHSSGQGISRTFDGQSMTKSQRHFPNTIAAILLICSLTSCSKPHPAATTSQPATTVVSQRAVLRLDEGLDAVIEPGTQVEVVASGFQFGEGPMWREGRLWFSDLVGNKMFAVGPD